MRFLSANKQEDLEELVERSPYMTKVVGHYMDSTHPDYEWLTELRREMAELDRRSEIIEARDEGLNEGRTQEKLTIAKNLHKTQMPIDEIATATGLTTIELENLQATAR
ncbi:MAG: hypothetical protein FWD27_08355 [Coriobacteriia bacterium]|nr:hypothetical protein [Coriobacteriia bacterium]